jgi:hypothetical protein
MLNIFEVFGVGGMIVFVRGMGQGPYVCPLVAEEFLHLISFVCSLCI